MAGLTELRTYDQAHAWVVWRDQASVHLVAADHPSG
jgi:hypothetical protein